MRSAIRVVAIIEASFVTGPAKNLLDFAKRARNGDDGLPTVEISIITYERRHSRVNAFVAAARDAGIPIDVVREKDRFDFGVIPQLKSLIAAARPDILQTHNVKSHFLVRASGLWKGCRWLAFQHGYTATDLRNIAYNQLDRWSLRQADHVITVCLPFARALERIGVPASRISVLHNSVKAFQPAGPDEVRAVRNSIPASPNHVVLVAIGRLSREKGLVDLLHALNVLRGDIGEERFHLVIVGEGPERSRIEAARDSLGLRDFVTLAGQQQDIRPYLQIADLLVMPSHSEGSPNALLEAMAAGVPVVASAVGGIPEIAVDGETAQLVQPRSPQPLAHALHRLMQDQPARSSMAEHARAVVAEHYTPEAYRRNLIEVYERLLQTSRQ